MVPRNKKATSPNYGITWSVVGGYVLRLGQKDGVNKFTGEAFPFHTEFFRADKYGGKRKALAACREKRDRLLATKEFMEYLHCAQHRLRERQGETITGVAGVGLNACLRCSKNGHEHLHVDMRVLYRQEKILVPSPRKVSLQKSFETAVALRDKLCGRKKRSKTEVEELFAAFLKKEKRRVRLMIDNGVPIWPADLNQKKTSRK